LPHFCAHSGRTKKRAELRKSYCDLPAIAPLPIEKERYREWVIEKN